MRVGRQRREKSLLLVGPVFMFSVRGANQSVASGERDEPASGEDPGIRTTQSYCAGF
jgi:hypothetical protein